MIEDLKKYEHFIPLIEEKVRVFNLELVKESNAPGFWTYRIIYFMDNEVKEDHVMGKDMSDALYRFSKIVEMPFTRFPNFLKS